MANRPSSATPSPSSMGSTESLTQFRYALVNLLNKLGNLHTQKTASEEIKTFLSNNVIQKDRMNMFLTIISEFNEHMTITVKKEYIKLYGVAAEVFGSSLIPFLPKILSYIQKRLREADKQLSTSISDSLGIIVHHVLNSVSSQEEANEQFNCILKMIYNNIAQPTAAIQSGAAMCLTRVIPNTPLRIMLLYLDDIVFKLAEFLPQSKAQAQLLESFISIVLSAEREFEPYVDTIVPTLIEYMNNPDWSTRKIAIDVIYSIAATLGNTLSSYKKKINEELSKARFDKCKVVRNAAIETLNVVKDIEEPELPPEPIPEKNSKRVEKKVDRFEKQEKQEKKQMEKKPIKDNFVIEKKTSKESIANKKTPTKVESFKGFQTLPMAFDKKRSPASPGEGSPKGKFQKSINPAFLRNAPKNNDDVIIFEAPNKQGNVTHTLHFPVKDINRPDPNKQTPQFNALRDEEFVDFSSLHHDVNNHRYSSKEELSSSSLADNFQNNHTTRLDTDNTENALINEISAKVSPIRNKNDSDNSINVPAIGNINSAGEHLLEHSNKSTERFDEMNHVQAPKQFVNPVVNQQTQGDADESEIDINDTEESVQNNNTFSNSNTEKRFNTSQLRESSNMQSSQMSLILLELEKMSKQQLKIMESMNNFQSFTRNEINLMKEKFMVMEKVVSQLSENIHSTNLSTHQASFGSVEEATFGTSLIDQQKQSRMNSSTALKNNNHHSKSLNKKEDKSWIKSINYLKDLKLNEAYSCILATNDDLMLIRLMGRTGIIIEQLDQPNIEYLLTRIIDLLISKEFVDFLLPWVTAAIDRKIDFSLDIQRTLLECMTGLFEASGASEIKLDEMQLCEMNRIYNIVNSRFSFLSKAARSFQ